MNHIQYAIHREEKMVISRVGDEVAWPILNYEKIGQGGDYRAPLEYNLEKCSVRSIGREWDMLVWTKYIPTAMKNDHREFWGMKPLPVEAPARTLTELCARHKTRFYYVKDSERWRFAHKKPLRLYGVCHNDGGSVRMYHWFRKTRQGYVLLEWSDNTEDDHKLAEKREIKKAA